MIVLIGSCLQVVNWYEATDINLRRGVKLPGKSDEFIIDADQIVQAVPLQRVTSDEDLERQLSHNKVVLIEVKQVSDAEVSLNADGSRYEETSTAM